MDKISYPYRALTVPLAKYIPGFITPNLIVLLGLLLGLLATYCLIQGQALICSGIVIVCVFLDHLDGDVARFRNQGTTFGAKFDEFSDRFRGLLMFSSMGIYNLNDNFNLFIFLPLICFCTNEFIINIIRPKHPSFLSRLLLNYDPLGWTAFSYLFPILLFLDILDLFFTIMVSVISFKVIILLLNSYFEENLKTS